MAQIYGTVGSLSYLLRAFKNNGITFFNTLEDIIKLNEEFDARLSIIQEETKRQLINENDQLRQNIAELSNEYELKIKERSIELNVEKNKIDNTLKSIKPYSIWSDDFISGLKNFCKRFSLEKRRTALNTHFEQEVRRPLNDIYQRLLMLKYESGERERQFETTLKNKINSNQVIIAKNIIDKNYSFLLGAMGETKALNELKTFPNNYSVINDFRYNFPKALHYRRTGDWIKSIQADHLLVAPSGVFLIETKNWSQESIQNSELYSPVAQVQRTGYAIFVLLNRILEQHTSLNHHWGKRKIPVHEIVLMIKTKPYQEFSNVKVLTLSTLCKHIKYFETIFDKDEVQGITDMLLRVNDPHN